MRTPIAVIVAATTAAGLTACANTTKPVAANNADHTSPSPLTAPAPQVLAIGVGDTSIVAPDTISAGIIEVKVTSTGKSRAHIALDRLAPGVTFDQIEKASSQQQDRLGTVVGGNGALNPGLSTSLIFDLAAGNYEIVQFTQGNGASPTHRLVVTAPSSTPALAPLAKGEIVAKGVTFTLPAGFDGQGTWKVTNNDAKDDHEATVLQLPAGKTIADVVAYFKSKDRNGPPPAIAMGGMGDLRPGYSGWMVMNLPPGNYALACFVPDDNGMPHVAMGMITPFRVL